MVLGDLAPIVMYLLWLNIIPGFNCTSLGSKLITIHYYTPKQREIKLKPGLKLNHNIYIENYTENYTVKVCVIKPAVRGQVP